jgi:hypothetical protein
MGTHTAHCLLQLYAASGRRREAAPGWPPYVRWIAARLRRLIGR